MATFFIFYLYIKNPDAHKPSAVLCFSWIFPKSIGQSFSAFSTSSLEYVSSVGGSHSLSETVLFLSLTLFRLISSKHFVHLLNVVLNPGSRYIRNLSGSVLLYSRVTLYTMTFYIKPHFPRFVKRFFLFFYI